MEISCKFGMQNKVTIIPLKMHGVIVAIHLGWEGLQYYVRYFDEAKAETVYFYEWELELNQ